MNHNICVSHYINLRDIFKISVSPLDFLDCSTESELYSAVEDFIYNSMEDEPIQCEGNIASSELDFILPDAFVAEWRVEKERALSER